MHSSTQIGVPETCIDRTITEKSLALLLNNHKSLGGSLAVIDPEVVVEAEDPLLVFLNPDSTKNLNDSYCVSPTNFRVHASQSDQLVYRKTINVVKSNHVQETLLLYYVLLFVMFILQIYTGHHKRKV